MSKEQVIEQLKDLAKIAGQDFMADVIDLVQSGKEQRLVDLTTELTELKVQALTADDPGDRRLYAEQIEDKLGSMAHVLATESIVASQEIGAMLSRAARAMLTGFATVAKPIIKASISTALGGIGGVVLGGLGDKLVDGAVDAVIDKLSPE